MYHENYNKFYSFTDTSEHKSAPLSTFAFVTKFVLCKDRHIHIPKFTLKPKGDSPSPSNVMNVPVIVHRTIDSNENEVGTLH